MNEEYLKGLTKEELIEIICNETTCTYQLKNNWNELKKWLEEEKMYLYRAFDGSRCIRHHEVLNKMQELEGNNE